LHHYPTSISTGAVPGCSVALRQHDSTGEPSLRSAGGPAVPVNERRQCALASMGNNGERDGVVRLRLLECTNGSPPGSPAGAIPTRRTRPQHEMCGSTS